MNTHTFPGSCCNSACPTPAPQAPCPVEPCCPPEPPCCPGGTVGKAPCHCLFDDFLATFPSFECLGEAKLCGYLKQADCLTQGFHDECLRDQALLYMAAHLAEMANVQATESGSRLAAMSRGVLSRPGSGDPSDSAWLSLSVWGMAYQGLVARNPIFHVLAI